MITWIPGILLQQFQVKIMIFIQNFTIICRVGLMNEQMSYFSSFSDEWSRDLKTTKEIPVVFKHRNSVHVEVTVGGSRLIQLPCNLNRREQISSVILDSTFRIAWRAAFNSQKMTRPLPLFSVRAKKKEDLRRIASELELCVSDKLTVLDLMDLIKNCDRYKNDPDSVHELANLIIEERKYDESQQLELEK
ncbi:hypothetical protein TNCV_365481 [Trichonephila clavipes]|nr:hypothetical protein TNCV_365481 [Trichonephila clavipes]